MDIGAGFGAFAVIASTEFADTAFVASIAVQTGSFGAACFETESCAVTSRCFVITTSRTTTVFDTDIGSGAVAVHFARRTIDTFASHTPLCITRTLHARTGVVHTGAVAIADTSVTAGGDVTGVFDTGRVGRVCSGVTDFAGLTGSGGTGIGLALPIAAELPL